MMAEIGAMVKAQNDYLSSHLIDSPNERILVIYGSGHLGWLRQQFANDPNIRLRKLAEFVN